MTPEYAFVRANLANALPDAEFAGVASVRLFAKSVEFDPSARLDVILDRVAADCGCAAELEGLRASSGLVSASAQASKLLVAASQLRYWVECACGSTMEYRLVDTLNVDSPRWMRLKCAQCNAEISWFVPSISCG